MTIPCRSDRARPGILEWPIGILLVVLSLVLIVVHSVRTTAHRVDLIRHAQRWLGQSSVERRGGVDRIFELADLLAAHERDADAIRLYEEALESDSWRFDYQLKLARLLHKRGDSQAAAEKAAEVQRSARDPRLARQAAKLLASIKSAPAAESGEAGGSHGPARSVESHESANPASPAATIREADLAIVPFGQIDHDLIDGVRGDLERQLGIHVWLLPESLPLGNPERTRAALFDHDQYNAERLTAWLQERIPATRSPRVIGYLGITAADIYGEGTNFIFGTAAPGAGVMSYARFLSPTGGDAAGDPLVRQRTLKQAISTSFFILGIPRCSSATCVRSYPHSVYEHDRKGSELCAECRQRLDAAVQRALTSPSEL